MAAFKQVVSDMKDVDYLQCFDRVGVDLVRTT